MKQKALVALVAGMALVSGSAFAGQSPVAQVVSVKGQVLVENAKGVRQLAKANMALEEGSNVIVLEKSSVQLKYMTSACKVGHQANTLLTIAEKAQCAAGQKVAVGQALPSASTSDAGAAGAGSSSAGGAGVSGATTAGTGTAVGTTAGTTVGTAVGTTAGTTVGTTVGTVVGTTATVGSTLASLVVPAAAAVGTVAAASQSPNEGTLYPPTDSP